MLISIMFKAFTGQLLGISKRTNIQFIKSIKIMSMDKTMLCTGDYFVLTVANDEDAPLCICIAAVLTTGYIIRKTKTSDDFGLDFDPLTD